MINALRLGALLLLLALFAPPSRAAAESTETNYDEARVPAYTLPDPLTSAAGQVVATPDQWRSQRRPEVLRLFEQHVYGRAPHQAKNVRFGEPEVDAHALDGAAVRKQLKVHFAKDANGPTADLLIYLPKAAKGPVPVFLGLNFGGNHTVVDDDQVWLPSSWMRPSDDGSVENNRATDRGRAARASRWQVREILDRGYALATAYYGDIDPDYDDDFQNGVHPLFYEAGQTRPRDDQWGSIAAWAWGLSRMLDYCHGDGDLDHARVAVIGHSRLGKTALWAAAADERFALAISNNSGCGGAALSRRRFGETVERINRVFPHWFCRNFRHYNDNEDALPVDQHMLAALIAPRPLYIASAAEDRWADPRGEFLTLKMASPVYDLLGRQGISNASMPPVDQPLMRDVAYHIRSGKHDVTLYDWQRYLDFADRHFK